MLSRSDYGGTVPGFELLVHRSIIRNSLEQQVARFNAVLKVRTKWFFFLDDDDKLPQGVEEVVAECQGTGAALAFTDELVVLENGSHSVRRGKPYSQAAHLEDAMLVHHLVVMRTEVAQNAVRRLPRGHYCPEFMLFWEVAKRGAVYVPLTGYVWHRRASGLHNTPWCSMGQMRSRLWAKSNP